MTESLTLGQALCEVEGEVLSSVEFVHDYVQLHFDGKTLTAYTLPAIELERAPLSSGQPGYRDGLCREIGQRVVRAEAHDEAVSLSFESGAIISISLREQDYKGPEALQFSLSDGRMWVA